MSSIIVKAIREMQETSERFRREGRTIAVVPTMGSLHRGHESLIARARSLADIVITDKNLLNIPENEIMKTKVDYTITGGKVVYSSGK